VLRAFGGVKVVHPVGDEPFDGRPRADEVAGSDRHDGEVEVGIEMVRLQLDRGLEGPKRSIDPPLLQQDQAFEVARVGGGSAGELFAPLEEKRYEHMRPPVDQAPVDLVAEKIGLSGIVVEAP